MKILWVTSQVLPLVADDLGQKKSGFGGWIMNMLNQLKHEAGVQLGVAMVSPNVETIFTKTVDGISCFVAPQVGKKGISENNRDNIIKEFLPDIIHIEGNEFHIHNAFSKVNNLPVLVSLQGILSGYEPYQYGEIPLSDLMFSFKRKHIIEAWVLFFRKHLLFDKRIKIETETIKNAQFIMGRTFWDRAHSYWINPKSKYYSCNRILRPTFYLDDWCFDKMEQHSIFVGNGYSPLKGLHFVLEAVALLREQFPDIRVYVAGNSPIVPSGKLTLHTFGYSRYIKKVIKRKKLENNVVFMGELQEVQMVERMKKSHIYVLPSLIENSPNTLGEAMMLGMPCVSAYTGGASEMAVDEKECLFYRSNDSALLAWQIKRLFDNSELAISLGEQARAHAYKTHDPIANKDALMRAYYDILKETNN